jgi:hypothetical protein
MVDAVETVVQRGAAVVFTVPYGPLGELIPRHIPHRRGHVHHFTHTDLHAVFGAKQDVRLDFLAWEGISPARRNLRQLAGVVSVLGCPDGPPALRAADRHDAPEGAADRRHPGEEQRARPAEVPVDRLADRRRDPDRGHRQPGRHQGAGDRPTTPAAATARSASSTCRRSPTSKRASPARAMRSCGKPAASGSSGSTPTSTSSTGSTSRNTSRAGRSSATRCRRCT